MQVGDRKCIVFCNLQQLAVTFQPLKGVTIIAFERKAG